VNGGRKACAIILDVLDSSLRSDDCKINGEVVTSATSRREQTE
jgi:hypothetical protein